MTTMRIDEDELDLLLDIAATAEAIVYWNERRDQQFLRPYIDEAERNLTRLRTDMTEQVKRRRERRSSSTF